MGEKWMWKLELVSLRGKIERFVLASQFALGHSSFALIGNMTSQQTPFARRLSMFLLHNNT